MFTFIVTILLICSKCNMLIIIYIIEINLFFCYTNPVVGTGT